MATGRRLRTAAFVDAGEGCNACAAKYGTPIDIKYQFA